MDEIRICKVPFFVRNATNRKANANANGIAAIAKGSTGFDCVWTENIIARIAGKLAK
jgi:hypothetical protein